MVELLAEYGRKQRRGINSLDLSLYVYLSYVLIYAIPERLYALIQLSFLGVMYVLWLN